MSQFSFLARDTDNCAGENVFRTASRLPHLGAKMLTCNCCAISRRKGSLWDMFPAFSWKNMNTGRCLSCSLLQSRGTSSQAWSLVLSAASSHTSCNIQTASLSHVSDTYCETCHNKLLLSVKAKKPRQVTLNSLGLFAARTAASADATHAAVLRQRY